MAIDLHNVTLEFLKSHDLGSGKEESLARLDFVRSRLSYDAFSDQSKETDLVSHEILISDTRFKGMLHSPTCLYHNDTEIYSNEFTCLFLMPLPATYCPALSKKLAAFEFYCDMVVDEVSKWFC